jgi:hypothetical protein
MPLFSNSDWGNTEELRAALPERVFEALVRPGTEAIDGYRETCDTDLGHD